jgi:hypothetical protein
LSGDIDWSLCAPSLRATFDEIWNKLEEGTEYDHPIFYNIRWLELLCDMQHG